MQIKMRITIRIVSLMLSQVLKIITSCSNVSVLLFCFEVTADFWYLVNLSMIGVRDGYWLNNCEVWLSNNYLENIDYDEPPSSSCFLLANIINCFNQHATCHHDTCHSGFWMVEGAGWKADNSSLPGISEAIQTTQFNSIL